MSPQRFYNNDSLSLFIGNHSIDTILITTALGKGEKSVIFYVYGLKILVLRTLNQNFGQIPYSWQNIIITF